MLQLREIEPAPSVCYDALLQLFFQMCCKAHTVLLFRPNFGWSVVRQVRRAGVAEWLDVVAEECSKTLAAFFKAGAVGEWFCNALACLPPPLSTEIRVARCRVVRIKALGSYFVKTYDGENVRNVAVIGHSHSGKTSLVSALLFTAGSTPRLGRVDDATTTTDYDEEEIARQMTISASLAAVEWGKTKINLIDTPGFNMFVHEAELAMPAVDAALVVVDSVSGVQVVTQKVWNFADALKLPRVVVCTRMDRERADFERVMGSLTNTFR